VPRLDFDPFAALGGPSPAFAPGDVALASSASSPPPPLGPEETPDSEVPWCERSAELQALAKLVEGVSEEPRLRSFLLTGAPGLGKTRLLRELRRLIVQHLALSRERVLLSRMGGEGAGPFSVFVELLRRRCDISPYEPATAARDKLVRVCRALLPAVRATEVANVLGELLQLPVPDGGPHTGSTSLVRSAPRLHLALRRFLAAEARRGPLVLLLDEMEHATPETMALISYLLDGLADLPVVIGLAARPELLDGFPDFGGAIVKPELMELQPMPPEDTAELLGAVVGSEPDELPPRLLEHVMQTAEGSPRAVVELVRLLVETGVLSWLPSDSSGSLLPQWDHDRLAEQPLPDSFHGLVAARWEAMAPASRELLEHAAVCGEHFHTGVLLMLARCQAAGITQLAAGDGAPEGPELADVLGGADPLATSVVELLDQLISQGVLLPLPHSQIAGEREYRFAYPPWQEVVYSGIASERRRRCHHLIAQRLELSRGGDREEVKEVVARHLERAGYGTEAARRYCRAAELSIERGALGRAPRLLLRALACTDAADLGAQVTLWMKSAEVLRTLGDLDAALRACERAVRLSFAMAARAQAARALYWMGDIHRHKGDPVQAIDLLTRAMAIFQELGDDSGRADALDDLGQVQWLLGRLGEALDHSARALELRRRLGDRRKVAASLLHIGFIELLRGLIDPAVGCFEEALRKHDGDPGLHAASLDALGCVDLLRGELVSARARFEEALPLCEPLGPTSLLAWVECHLGEALLYEGLLDEAEARLLRANEVAKRLTDRLALAEIKRLLGLIRLRRGDQQGAVALCEKALDQAQQSGLKPVIGRALLALGEAHAATLFDESAEGEPPAWDCFRRAVALLREIDDQANLAHALAALGRHLIERGKRGSARAALREAVQIADRLRMRLGDELRAVLAEL
jgi:tetratricopeptide (TPR) repeat protein